MPCEERDELLAQRREPAGLELDEQITTHEIDDVTVEDVRGLVEALFASERLSAAGIGPDADAFGAALEPLGAAAVEVA